MRQIENRSFGARHLTAKAVQKLTKLSWQERAAKKRSDAKARDLYREAIGLKGKEK